MNITINQITNQQETVQNTVLSKILAAKRNNGTVNLTGNIYISAAYADEVQEFCTYFGLTEDENSPGTYRGNNIILSIGTSYISFQDNEVARIVNGTFGADGHTTLQQAADAVFTSSTFKNNTTITAFPEFDLFTKANINPPNDLFYGCVNLENIDMSKVSIIRANEFRGTKITDVNCPELTGLSGGSCFSDCTSLKTITNLGNINTICSWCFNNCTSLQTVILPSSITVIEGNVFRIGSGSTGAMTSITNLEKVTSIGSECFLNQSLLVIDVGTLTKLNNLGQSAFDYCHSIYGVINMPNLLTAAQSALRACAGITKIKCLGKISAIPNMFISKHGYSGTMALTEAYIPYECTSIGYNGFYGCSALTTVKQYTQSVDNWTEGTEPTYTNLSKITSFGDSCFDGCTQLSISNSDIQGAVSIGQKSFMGTLLSGSLNLPNLSSLQKNSFTRNLITSIDNLGSVTEIPNSCFSDNYQLQSISLPSSVTKIDSGAFSGCTSLPSVNFSNLSNLTTLNDRVFQGDTSLVSIDLSGTAITTLKYWTVYQCYALTLIKLPSTITYIEGGALQTNSKTELKVVLLSTTPPTLENANAFGGTDNQGNYHRTIYVPDASLSAYQNAGGYWNNFTSLLQPLSNLT